MTPPHQRQHIQRQYTDEYEEALSFGVWLRQRRWVLDLTQEALA